MLPDRLPMLAWIQRAWVTCLLLASIATGALGSVLGWPWWVTLPVVVLVANIHASVLAIEFFWLRTVEPGQGIPRPTMRVLVKAWSGEVVTGLRVFGWRQPFRSNAVRDELHGCVKGRGVLLVHGFVCNRGLWNSWMTRLCRNGTPYLAINLEPVLGPIDRYVESIETAVTQLETATGRPPIIVAHSMGGLAVRAWLRDRTADHRVHSIITIGTPHAGTAMARFALSPNTRQMREGNEWLCALAGSERAERRRLFTCYFSHCDNIVFPASNAMLPDAENRHVPGVAHVHLAFHRPILDDVLGRAAQ
jgi:pimeloyl-ACP methyl ester carboxylesterase